MQLLAKFPTQRFERISGAVGKITEPGAELGNERRRGVRAGKEPTSRRVDSQSSSRYRLKVHILAVRAEGSADLCTRWISVVAQPTRRWPRIREEKEGAREKGGEEEGTRRRKTKSRSARVTRREEKEKGREECLSVARCEREDAQADDKRQRGRRAKAEARDEQVRRAGPRVKKWEKGRTGGRDKFSWDTRDTGETAKREMVGDPGAVGKTQREQRQKKQRRRPRKMKAVASRRRKSHARGRKGRGERVLKYTSSGRCECVS